MQTETIGGVNWATTSQGNTGNARKEAGRIVEKMKQRRSNQEKFDSHIKELILGSDRKQLCAEIVEFGKEKYGVELSDEEAAMFWSNYSKSLGHEWLSGWFEEQYKLESFASAFDEVLKK